MPWFHCLYFYLLLGFITAFCPMIVSIYTECQEIKQWKEVKGFLCHLWCCKGLIERCTFYKLEIHRKCHHGSQRVGHNWDYHFLHFHSPCLMPEITSQKIFTALSLSIDKIPTCSGVSLWQQTSESNIIIYSEPRELWYKLPPPFQNHCIKNLFFALVLCSQGDFCKLIISLITITSCFWKRYGIYFWK